MGVPGEQPPPGRVLQLAHVLAHGGLPQAEPVRGLREAQRLRHREERPQLYGVEHGPGPVTHRAPSRIITPTFITLHDDSHHGKRASRWLRRQAGWRGHRPPHPHRQITPAPSAPAPPAKREHAPPSAQNPLLAPRGRIHPGPRRYRRPRGPAPRPGRGRHRRRRRVDRCRGAALLPLRRPALHPGSGGRDAPVAAAPDGAGVHVRPLPPAGAGRRRPRPVPPDATPLHRPALPVPGALHRPVLDRLHLDSARQRRGGDLRGLLLQPHRDRRDAAAGGAPPGR